MTNWIIFGSTAVMVAASSFTGTGLVHSTAGVFDAGAWPYENGPSIDQMVVTNHAGTDVAAITAAGDLAYASGVFTVTGLQGRAVSSAAPSNLYVLAWNQGAGQWQPTNPTALGFPTWANDLAGSTDSAQYVAAISGNAGAGGTVNLGATVVLTALTGAGGFDFSAWTGAGKLPSGNISWAGASGKTLSLVSTLAAITVTAGATSTWGTSGAGVNLTLQAGGTLFLGANATSFALLSTAGIFQPVTDVTGSIGSKALRWASVATGQSGYQIFNAVNDSQPLIQLTSSGVGYAADGAHAADTWLTRTGAQTLTIALSTAGQGAGTLSVGGLGGGATDSIQISNTGVFTHSTSTLGVHTWTFGTDGGWTLDAGSTPTKTFTQATPTSDVATPAWVVQSASAFASATLTHRNTSISFDAGVPAAGGTATASFGATNATIVQVGNSGAAVTISGSLATAALTVTGAFTQSGGAFSATGNAASQLSTSASTLTCSGFTGLLLQKNGATYLDVGVTASTCTLAAGISLAGAAGAGALSCGSMTGAATMPTGNFGWTGASGATCTLAATAAAISITCATSGALTLTGAASSVLSTTTGSQTVQGATTVVLQSNGASGPSWTLAADGGIALSGTATPANTISQANMASTSGAPSAGATFNIRAQAGQTTTQASTTGGNGAMLQDLTGNGGGSTGTAANSNGGERRFVTGIAGTGGSGAAGSVGIFSWYPGNVKRLTLDFAVTTAAVLTYQGQQATDFATTAGNLRFAGNGGTALYYGGAGVVGSGTLALDANITNAGDLTTSVLLCVGASIGGNPAAAVASAPMQDASTSIAAPGSTTTTTLTAAQAACPNITLTGTVGATTAWTIVLPNTKARYVIDASGLTITSGGTVTIEAGSNTKTIAWTSATAMEPYLIYCNGSSKMYSVGMA